MDHEAAEVFKVRTLPLDEVMAMARANQISDDLSALALLLAEPRLRKITAAEGE